MGKDKQMEIAERMKKAEAWECPDCGHKLEVCSAREVHEGLDHAEKGRKCPGPDCTYTIYMEPDNMPSKPKKAKKVKKVGKE